MIANTFAAFFSQSRRWRQIYFQSYCEVEKKCPSLIFEYLQKLQELALDIYGAFTQTFEVFADIIFMVEISILVEISTTNPQLKGSKSAGK